MKKPKKYYKAILEELPEDHPLRSEDQGIDLSSFREKDFYSNFWGILSYTPWGFEEDSQTSEFLDKYEQEFDWYWISRSQMLPIDSIRKHINKLDMRHISENQPLDKEFIKEFADNLDWRFLPTNQPVVDRELIEANIDRGIKPMGILYAQQLPIEDRLELIDKVREGYQAMIQEVTSREMTIDDLIELESKLGKFTPTEDAVYTMNNLFQYGKFTDKELDDILNIFEESDRVSIEAIKNLGLYQNPGKDLVIEYVDLFDSETIMSNPYMLDEDKKEILSAIRLEELGFNF